MARWVGRIALAIGVVTAAVAVYAYQKVGAVDTVRISDDVHVLTGFGSNVGVLRTERGAVVVDTMTFRMQGEEVRQLAEKLTGREVAVILNTHYHMDHTHGNPAFPGGTRVVATKRTRALLDALDADAWKGDAAKTLPGETFDGSHEIALGGKTVRALSLGRGHTSGDLVVLFVEDRVLHAGDLFFNQCYPSVDLEAGGSIEAWIATLDRVLALDGYDKVIPGHGPVSDREGLRRFQSFLKEVWEKTSAAAHAGKSLDETLAAVSLTQDAGYAVLGVPLVFRLDRASVIRRAWEEAAGKVKLAIPLDPTGGN